MLALLAVFLLPACRSGSIFSNVSTADHSPGADSGLDDDALANTADQSGGGYPSKVSVVPGESLNFHISNGRSGAYSLSIYREGATRQLMATIPNVQSQNYSCAGKAATGCDWPVEASFTVPIDWPTGVYTVEIPRAGSGRYQTLFFVREKNPGAARILFLTSVNTFHAYNVFGGGSLYETELPKQQKVSFDRPYGGNGLGHFDRWERHFVEWAEAAGYPVAYAATYDLEFLPNLLTPYDVVVIAGHSEYWTWDMRQRVNAYVANGGRFVNLSGNTMWWQVRFEDNGRTMVSYKNWADDPIKTREGTTDVNWRYPIYDSSFLTTGLHWPFGGYPGENGKGFYAVKVDHWIYSGTSLAENELFGKGPTRDTSIHDKESDGLAFNCAEDGTTILGPIRGTGTPANFTILGVVPVLSKVRGMNGVAAMGIYTHPSGGAVFSAGTTGWVLGLDQPAVDRITRNVLDRFLAGNFPQEPPAADADVLFRDRFNCANLDLNRGPMQVQNEDATKLNYVDAVKGTANRLTAECGYRGTGLALKPSNGSRYVINLTADWSGVDLLYTSAHLNLSDLMMVENSTIDLIHAYHDDGQNDPVPVAVLQLGRRNGQPVVRYQPNGANQAWIPVPPARFFLLETLWNSQTGMVTLSIDGQQRASEPLPQSAPRLNRADMGTIVVSGNASGTLCLDELVYNNSTVDEPPPPPPPTDVFYLSFTTAGTQATLAYDDEDILRYQPASNTWSIWFDGSDVGLAGVDVDAFAFLPDGTLLLSLDKALGQLGNVGAVAEADIVRFVPTSMGENTSGQFAMYVDGSDVGLAAKPENIDALAVLADGRLLVSTLGNATVGAGATAIKGRSHDLLALTLSQTGADSAGQWAMYFDGSDVALTSAPENVDGVWAAADGTLLLSTVGAATVPDLAFGPADLVTCLGARGSASTCSYSLAWQASSAGLGETNVDGVDVAP